MSCHRGALVAALAFGLRVAALDASPAKQLDTPQLTVMVNDYAGAAPAVLESAKSTVTFIYRVAGVEVDWIDRNDPRLPDDDFMKSIVTVVPIPRRWRIAPAMRIPSSARPQPEDAR